MFTCFGMNNIFGMTKQLQAKFTFCRIEMLDSVWIVLNFILRWYAVDRSNNNKKREPQFARVNKRTKSFQGTYLFQTESCGLWFSAVAIMECG